MLHKGNWCTLVSIFVGFVVRGHGLQESKIAFPHAYSGLGASTLSRCCYMPA